MAYATVEQYENRYGEVSNPDMLQECLDDCTATINAELSVAASTIPTPPTSSPTA